MTTFSMQDVPDMTGKTAVITGANSGIGLATARALAKAGANVVLAVRDPARGRTAADTITGKAEVRVLDLASLDSVRAFARDWKGPIDLLINNAAAPALPERRLTADGFELQFGTDHLGHFALTNLLLEHVVGRVVTLASQAERFGRLDFDDLSWDKGYKSSRAYGRAKLANLLFSAELQRRLTASGSSVLAQSAHPGFVATEIYRDSGLVSRMMVRTMAQSPDQGALPVLYAALGELPGDSFTGPSHLMHMRGKPQLIKRSAAAQDAALASRLWSESEKLTLLAAPSDPRPAGLDFPMR